MKYYKVAFIGTHDCGKSTLTHELYHKFKMKGAITEIVEEVSRDCPFPVNQAATKEAQRWILFSQMAEELKRISRFPVGSKKLKVLVCDRSVLDNYAYFVKAVGRDKIIEQLIKDWLKTYHIFIYVPPETSKEIEEDGFRDTDIAFREEIDNLVLKLCNRFKVAPFKLNPKKRSHWLPDLTKICNRIVRKNQSQSL